MTTNKPIRNISTAEWNIVFYGRELGIKWLFPRDGELFAFLWNHIKDFPEAKGKEAQDFVSYFEKDNQLIITAARPGEGA